MRKFFALLGMLFSLSIMFNINACLGINIQSLLNSPKVCINTEGTLNPALKNNCNTQNLTLSQQINIMGLQVPIKITKGNKLCKVLPKTIKGCVLIQKCISATSKIDNSKYGGERFKCNNSEVNFLLITGNQATILINRYRLAVAQQNSNVNSFDIQGYEAGAIFKKDSGTIGVILQENPDEVLLLNYQNMSKEQAISILNSLDLTSLKIKN